ncbi:ferredoxin reductase family protein [Microbacterium xanthum]|uniref:ferredoxin reductase family protein n=1 Tax=Microbacterium xanthum TaxID=3079794 RepID=UPI002AD2E2EB|nr:ferric reductase-like transmembrane domain-containing protein [Microbacterium sp. KSW-48]MDZ8172828.1 ferric reductase-like transmembrane domain-containing protein [Microbacterium sp. KSW-48]
MPPRMPFRALSWTVLYALLALAPLIVSLVQLDPGRGFWVNLSVAAGFVGLSLMGLQFVLAAHAVRTARVFGLDLLLRFHRQMTWLIALLIFAHPIILFVWDARFLALLDVTQAPARARFAVVSVILLGILIVTSVWRRRLRIRYAVWQVAHSVLATLIVITALAHVLLIGYYVGEAWEKALWVLYSLAFVSIGVWVRVVRPIVRWRRRWRVVAVENDAAGSSTVILEQVDPSAFGPKGFAFHAGQYAWIHAGGSPFAMTYHPFSFSSSAQHPEQVRFTIKPEQGFTATVPDLAPGSVVYLDGPWGHLTMERNEAEAFVFIAAGVGVTPMLSMLATLTDRGDERPCLLILGNRHEDRIIGGEALERLQQRMPGLEVVHVISRPGEVWGGESGRIRVDLLDRVLPRDRLRRSYFLCASGPVMDAATGALIDLGIPESSISAERFAMA